MSLDIGNVTVASAAAARDALGTVARGAGERTMATVAERAIFAEALLAAVKARVNEFKTVAK